MTDKPQTLQERLREIAKARALDRGRSLSSEDITRLMEAAAAIDAKDALLAEAVKALEPFAAWAVSPGHKPALSDCENAVATLTKLKAANDH